MKRLLFLLVFLPQLLFGQTDLTPNGWVNDYASILNQDEIQKLNSKISSFEKQTDIEIAVAVVSTLNDKDVESFANELFKHWGVGKKNRNNGILVVIAPNERKWRIEIGYGLEPYLSDGDSHQIGESNFKPNFKEKQYFKGIDGFLTTLISHLGTSTWEDRVVYNEKLKAEREENLSNFLWGFLYVSLSIIALIVSIFSFKRFREKRERELELKRQKLMYIERYKSKLKVMNSDLEKYKFLPLEYNKSYEKMIMDSASTISLDLNYNTIILSSFEESKDLLKLAVSLNESTSKMFNLIDNINKKENKYNITKSEIPTNVISFNGSSDDIIQMRRRLNLINEQVDKLSIRSEKISLFSKMLSIGTLDISIVDNKLNHLTEKFKGEVYGLNEINDYYNKIKTSYDNFNNSDKSFDNLDKLESSLHAVISSEERLDNYVDFVTLQNKKHKVVVEMVNNSDSEIGKLKNKLSDYQNHSDVSSSTKQLIAPLLVLLLAYKASSDILASYDILKGFMEKTDDLVKKAKSDIGNEEDRRRNSYYSSSSWSSSSSSSDSSSSWSGFGGGDSGGGGSSGDW